ncbi:MAG TPA: enoyl-CoA hydratase/isomerase family protein [Burkholderiaceae bacterium]|nr:enoyl-CoA hydratase/isomerase family protein [Burkholderiaceae bacterium]
MPVRVERPEPRVAVVVVDNPTRRNALGEPEFRGLAAAWAALEREPAVRAVVVRGEGEAFCAGADLSAAGLASLPDIDELIDAALLKTRFFPKPLVAAIGGACVAGGLELALSCDLRVIAAGARIGLPEVRWGILPSGGAAMKLADQIGQADAMRLLLTGELVDGAEAARLGLGTLAPDGAAALDEAMRLARAIAAASPVAVQATKRAAAEARQRAYADREPAERALVARVRASGHAAIGARAFLERRVPDYPD